MYALAQSVWVVFLARALMGAGIQFGAATLHTYLGEMGSVMDNIRQTQGKKPRKFILYIMLSFVLVSEDLPCLMVRHENIVF